MLSEPALSVANLSVRFASPAGPVAAASDVSFTLAPGEMLALMGESGSGKSVTARAATGLLRGAHVDVRADAVHLAGTNVTGWSEKQWRPLRGRGVSMVFQDALSALNPVFSVGHQIAESLRVHGGISRRDARARVTELLRTVRIPAPEQRARDYPHQFSGGMRQRILLAMAIAGRPAVLIADEPTTALDVTVQAQLLDLIDSLRRDRGMAVLLITHDMGVVARVADRAAVMYAGRIVEMAPVPALFADPAHPYTEALLRSVPGTISSAGDAGGDLPAIPGTPPNPARLPTGCAFAPRCHRRVARCEHERPPLTERGPGRLAACHVSEAGTHAFFA